MEPPLLRSGGGRRLSGGRGSSEIQCQFHIDADYPLPELRLRPLPKGEVTAEYAPKAFASCAVQLEQAQLSAAISWRCEQIAPQWLGLARQSILACESRE